MAPAFLSLKEFSCRTFRSPVPLARLAFIAALPLGIGTPLNIAHAQQALSLKDSVPTVTTNGVGSSEVAPDFATISLGVDTERSKAADAARENARTVQAIVGEIKAQGIEAKDIKTLSVTLSPQYDEIQDANGQIKRTLRGYTAHNSLSVRIWDIAKAGILAGQLMDKGANNFEGIAFDYTQKEAKYDALRGDAVRDALRKANSYVNGLGLKLGRSLGNRHPDILPRARRDAGEYGFRRQAHSRRHRSGRARQRSPAKRSPGHLGARPVVRGQLSGGLIPSASASRILAEPGGKGFCWLSCGAQPETKIISKVARTRPPGSANRSA